uniref:TPR_REGION domain-containing protein n=1 Tax=Schistosoma mansoni TaxID=6183 RepID=A0A3Q0KQE5_SCHMA
MSETPTMKHLNIVNADETPEVSNLELFLEFINCVMSKDFRQAINLAKQILESEPNNSQIQDFLPLLNEADYMKTAGVFHSVTDDSDTESEGVDDDNSYLSTSTDTDSSDDLDYTSSDSDSYRCRKKVHGS